MEHQNPLGASVGASFPPRKPHINGALAAVASPRGRALDFRSFPADADERERLDAISQAPDGNGKVLCWRRRRGCNNPDCRDPQTLAPYKFKETD